MAGVWRSAPRDLVIAFRTEPQWALHLSFADPVAIHTMEMPGKLTRVSDAETAEISGILSASVLSSIEHRRGERAFEMRFVEAERLTEEAPSKPRDIVATLMVSLIPGRAGSILVAGERLIGRETLRPLFASHQDATTALEELLGIDMASLPDAIQRHSSVLPPHFRNAVLASTRLPDGLERLRSLIGELLRGESSPAVHRLPSPLPGFLHPLYLAPFAYESLGQARSFADVERAASYYFGVSRAIAHDLRLMRALEQGLRAEARRIDLLEEALEADRVESEQADAYQHCGEALLIVPPETRESPVESRWYDERGEHPERVPLFEGLDARASARRYFAMAKKARRAAEYLASRRAALTRRRHVLGDLKMSLARAASSADLRALQQRVVAELGRAAVAVSIGIEAGGARARQPRRRAYAQFLSEEGEILVGRSATENVELTFRVASPEDLWLHARDVPGSHVVLRLRRGVREPSPATLTRAASLAAYFSKARRDTSVEVCYTRRKFVRKIKGGILGQVRLERFKTIAVAPARDVGEQNAGQAG